MIVIGSQLPPGAGQTHENILGGYLAAGVPAGLGQNAAVGQVGRPAVALGIAALAIKEDREAWRAAGCRHPLKPATDAHRDA